MGRFLQFESVTFGYPGSAEPVFANVSAHFPEGAWTGVVGANGCGKTTLLKLATGRLEPASGSVCALGSAYCVEQRTDAPPPEADEFMNSWDAGAIDLRDRLGVSDGWSGRWDSLSHGERKRLQIAVALWRAPDVLALDEPTNHLDSDARRALLDALSEFGGAGLLVSHDRAFLDELCSRCLFIFPPRAVMRPGGVTQGMAEDRREQTQAREEHDAHAAKARRLRNAAQQRREAAEQSASRTKAVKRGMNPKNDHDGKAKRRLAKLTGRDGWGVAQSASLRRRAAELFKNEKPIRPEYKTGFWLDDRGVSRRNHVLDVPAGTLPLGDGRVLFHPELRVGPADRIALVGANGCGKTSLLRHLLPRVNVPEERLLVVPQEITEDESRRIQEETKKLDREPLGRVMTLVSRLGSRPGRLLESNTPSPGEVRKLLLARGVDRGPHLIVMDEPTNHLDLPSIECLENALAETPCAMILVSHDERFLSKLVDVCWELTDTGGRIELAVIRRDRAVRRQ